MCELNLNNEIKIIIEKFKNKNFSFVINKTTSLLKKKINNDFLWNIKGLSFQSIGDHINALDCFKFAIKINPKNIDAKNNLGLLYQMASKLKEAENCFEECIKLDPNFVNSLINLGNLKIKTNNFNEAILIYNKVLKINQNIEIIYLHLGQAYQNTKQFEKAEIIFKKALKKFPLLTKADKLLSMQTNYSTNEEHLNLMLDKINKNELNIDHKIDLSFSIAKAFEDKKNYSQSFNYLAKGNGLKRSKLNFNIKDQIKLFESIKSYFSNFKYKEKIHDPKKRVIFIFGLPRSGTTLVENIISSHNQVSGVGEINFLTKFFRLNFYKENKINLDNVNNFLNLDLQKEYFNYLKSFNLKNDIITDKSLNVYFNLGFIKYFFPGSKFIHCHRNAKDNCLSIYKNLFNDNVGWKYDQKEIVDYYNLYQDIVNFWNEKLNNDILHVKYEDLIRYKEPNIKKIINYCDLKWDENCLHHQNNDMPIKTLSFNQANRPIYSSSINSSKNFENYLKNMFDKLK
jgi:tetratricopeptide (TPR) repeat protein